jgi:hypothetical protein
MEWLDILKLILAIISGVATCIPLVVKLVKYIKELAKEKNWGKLVVIVSNFMAEAETLFPDGASKKDYVINSVMAISKTIDYPVDKEILGELIDNLTKLSNKINVNKK